MHPLDVKTMYLLVVATLLTQLINVNGIPLDSFYPFGSSAGDIGLPPNDDDSSAELFLMTPFRFFGTMHDSLFVNNNGDISFGNPEEQYTPESFPLSGGRVIIAPYWADVDTLGTGSVWYRQTDDPQLLARARQDVNAFSPTLLFIATWDRVGYFDQKIDKTNTFQCILATNGVVSYVIFLYADGEIQWTTGDESGGIGGFGGTPAQVGFNAGDGVNFANVPGSQTPEVINIDSTSNVGIDGVWIFGVDGEEIVPATCFSNSNVTLPNFVCSNNVTIPRNLVCDGVVDCSGGGDEIGSLCENRFVPVFEANASYVFNVSEDTLVGQTSGNIFAIDQDFGPAGDVIFSISGDGNERFRISTYESRGVITLAVTLDRESTGQYDLTVVVEDQGEPAQSCSVSLTIEVADVNDNPPVFTEDLYVFYVDEGSPIGTVFGMVVTEDQDTTLNAMSLFHLEVPLNETFEMQNSSGIIITSQSLDYESVSEYAGYVTACNVEYPSLCNSVPVLIRINDVNEFFPEFAQQKYRIDISSNFLVGTPLIRPIAYDGDTGSSGDIIRYGLLSEEIDLFDIEEDTGVVYLARSIESSEAGQTYVINITAMDGGNPSLAGLSTVSIQVNDITVFDTSYNFFIWSENTDTSDFMEQIPSTGSFGPITFYPEEVLMSPFNPLIISGPMNDTIQFKDTFFPDREGPQFAIFEYYTLILRSESEDSFTSVTLRITDENDNTPYLLLDTFHFAVAENEIFTFPLGLFVVDNDIDANNRRVNYTLTDERGIFRIDSSGVFSTQTTLDREASDFYSVTVVVADAGISESAATANTSALILIDVIDVNDNAPIFRNIQSGNTRVQVLGDNFIEDFYVSVTDDDVGENAIIVLSLENADTLPFEIDPLSGLLAVKEGSANLQGRYSLIIRAEDRGSPRLMSLATLDVEVFRSDAVLVSIFPGSDDEQTAGEIILANNSVIQTRLNKRLVIACSSLAPTALKWLDEGSISYNITEVRNAPRFSGGSTGNISGSGSGKFIGSTASGSGEFSGDSISGSGSAEFFGSTGSGNAEFSGGSTGDSIGSGRQVLFRENTILATVDGNIANEGILKCASIESGETVILHFSNDFCMCALPNQVLSDVLQSCDLADFTACACPSSSFNCMCQQPVVGDGDICTPDTDGDSIPNVVLPSCSLEDAQQSYCTEDNCPADFNPEQDLRTCGEIEEGFGGCLAEVDSVWDIQWNDTYGGLYDTQPCSGDSTSIATRFCMSNGEWGLVNVTNCASPEITGLGDETTEVLTDPTLSTEERVDRVTTITGSLANATVREAEDVPLFPQDLLSTNQIVNNVVGFLIDTVTEGNTPTQLNEDLIQILDNVLDESNIDGWNQVEERVDGGQMLLNNTELYGQYIVAALMSDTVESGDQDRIILNGTSNNIVLEARIQNASNELSTVSFQSGMSQSRIVIPASLLRERAAVDGSEMVSTVNIAMMNIQQFLPDAFREEMTMNATDNITTRAAAMVLSSQILTGVTATLNSLQQFNTSAQLSFQTESVQRAFNPRCAFWNLSNRIEDSGWSTMGVATVSNTSDPDTNTFDVICETQHLTSFCVLVDITGEEITGAEQIALEIVSYIGCGISLLFLLLTILFFLSYGKKLFTSVHIFVHLNLAVSLFLGYLTFVVGIENATSSVVGCKLVASLLHYFFLSAFCWMLCEGVMLYLLLVVVFSKLARRWWVFLLLGWGLPIIVVAVAVGIVHEQYGVRNDDGDLQYCWISVERGAIWAFVGPMLLVVVANVFFWILALKALYKVTASKQYRAGSDDQTVLVRKLFLAAVVLLPLLGLTWVFGLLAVNRSTTLFAWLFTILNSLQGLFIFIFHVLRSDKLWKNKDKKKRRTTRRATTNSTALSSDAVIVFENPSMSSPFDAKWKKDKGDEIGLTTRTWI